MTHEETTNRIIEALRFRLPDDVKPHLKSLIEAALNSAYASGQADGFGEAAKICGAV